MTTAARPTTTTTRPSEPPVRSAWRLQIALIALVWAGIALVTGGGVFEVMRRNWTIALTMVFGSLVGGGTSEGGGAVAFPIFTKVLAIPAPDARIFTYLIQSVGMSAASLVILAMRVPIERRAVLLGAPAGVVGVVLSSTLIAPRLPSPTIRVFFTVLLTALGIALLIKNLRGTRAVHRRIPVVGTPETSIMLLAGFAGGVLSGLVGVGENTVMFIVLVLLFRVSEKIATPTTVIMMTVVSIAAALSHLLLLHDVSAKVTGYWLAAAPVVVVFAPIGAVICSRISRDAVWRTLIVLIAAELVSTIVLVPFTPLLAATAGATLVVVTVGCACLVRVRRYGDNATQRT